MNAEKPAVLFTEEVIRRRVVEMACRISSDYADVEELLLVGILRGCFIFLADLSRLLTVPRSVDFIAVSSYGRTTTSTGAVRLILDLRTEISGKHVLIVDDDRRHGSHPPIPDQCVEAARTGVPENVRVPAKAGTVQDGL